MVTNTASFRRGLLIGSAAFALLSAPAFAQDATTQGAAPAPAAPSSQSPSTTPLGEAASATGTPGASAAAPTDQGEIIVTGTLIRNPAAASASPLVQLSTADLAARGINTVADAIQKLSSNNAGTLSTNWSANGFATGASAPSLRGLNDAYTLTVFDNLRSAVYPLADDTSRNFVDINTIPDSIVDHIDVLQDGASSLYGSDAIAGVVNVIIKKQIKGLHANVSGALSSHKDFGEQRADLTYGYGDLASQGFNVWVNGEYQHNATLYQRDRGFPFNTDDLSSICGVSNGNNPDIPAGTKTCMNNGVANGIQADGTLAGLGTTTVPLVRPWDPATNAAVVGSKYQFLDPSAGCGNLTPYTLTADQQAANPTAPSVVCQRDGTNRFGQYDPDIQRFGGNARLTVNIGSRAQAYAMFNFYETKTFNTGAPQSFANQTAAGGTQVLISPVLLPAYVCARGTTGDCTASNGTLNPNNPFAAQGLQARLVSQYDLPTSTSTDARTFRGSAGINGSFGDDWNYNLDFTTSRVLLRIKQRNDILAQHLLDVIADGSYNFIDQSANTQDARDYLAPANVTNNSSSLTQIQGSLSKSLFALPGGDFQVVVGGAYRKEHVNEPSANAPNEDNPYDRYFGINAVSVVGGRNVKSAFFEVDAPVLKILDLKAQGRYDKYSTGQHNFSPKFEAIFHPISQIKLRGTYSKGFRVPSLAQAFGLPATGYTSSQIDRTDPNQLAFINAHNGDAYATQSYSIGTTSSGNPELKPEKSTQWTAGFVLQPTPHLTFTADYYHLKLKNLIGAPPACTDIQNIAAQYYANNGTVNVEGCTVSGQTPDQNYPNALPLLGFIAYSYVNSGTETTRGVDLSATLQLPIADNIRLTSSGTATYVAYLAQNIGGTIQRYDGSLSPCNITSCSGTPKWRATWENTLEVGKATISATAYYTSGYNLESTDYGGVNGDCEGSIGVSIVTYADGVTPVKCSARRFIDVDMTASYKVTDKLTLYTNVLNVLGTRPPFDPSAGYNIYQFNPAWADQGFVGRYYRIGAKIDF